MCFYTADISLTWKNTSLAQSLSPIVPHNAYIPPSYTLNLRLFAEFFEKGDLYSFEELFGVLDSVTVSLGIFVSLSLCGSLSARRT